MSKKPTYEELEQRIRKLEDLNSEREQAEDALRKSEKRYKDPVQINQLLMNLCTNASQAMEETGGILEITVENESISETSAPNYPSVAKGNYVKLTVSDTGPGIEPEIIGRIFDPYFTTKEMGKGSGTRFQIKLSITGPILV